MLEHAETRNYYVATWRLDGTPSGMYGRVPDSLSFDAWLLLENSAQKKVVRQGSRELLSIHHDEMFIVIGRSLDIVFEDLGSTRQSLWLVGIAVMGIGSAGGWLLTGKAIRPIQTISQSARAIASGDRSHRTSLPDAPEELASLARILNSTFDYLDETIETQKRFSADASHELRTPIAIIITQAQAALKRDRSTEEYITTIEACLRAGQRMRSLAEGLVDLTRIDGKGTILNRNWCILNDVVSDAANSASHLSAKHPVDFQGLEHPIQLNLDKARIHQMVTNLLSNAIKHNPAGCAIHVSLQQTLEEAIITVAHEGCGIPPESFLTSSNASTASINLAPANPAAASASPS